MSNLFIYHLNQTRTQRDSTIGSNQILSQGIRNMSKNIAATNLLKEREVIIIKNLLITTLILDFTITFIFTI
jgi:hypothetical protein